MMVTTDVDFNQKGQHKIHSLVLTEQDCNTFSSSSLCFPMTLPSSSSSSSPSAPSFLSNRRHRSFRSSPALSQFMKSMIQDLGMVADNVQIKDDNIQQCRHRRHLHEAILSTALHEVLSSAGAEGGSIGFGQKEGDNVGGGGGGGNDISSNLPALIDHEKVEETIQPIEEYMTTFVLQRYKMNPNDVSIIQDNAQSNFLNPSQSPKVQEEHEDRKDGSRLSALLEHNEHCLLSPNSLLSSSFSLQDSMSFQQEQEEAPRITAMQLFLNDGEDDLDNEKQVPFLPEESFLSVDAPEPSKYPFGNSGSSPTSVLDLQPRQQHHPLVRIDEAMLL